MSADAVVAGRLEIPVESNTKGFKERLKKAIDAEAKDVKATVGVDVSKKGLRKRLQESVDEAAKGVNAEVGVKIKTKNLKAKLAAAVKAAGPVSVDADLKKFGATVREHLDRLSKERVTVSVAADEKGMNTLLARWRAKMKAGLAAPVGAPSVPGGGAGGGKGGSGFKMPEFGGGIGARSAFMPIGILGLASVIQPAIAAVVGSLGGLVAMAGAAAAAVNTLGGAGGALGTLGAAFAGVTIAMRSVFEGKAKDLPKELRGIREEVDNLGGSWAEIRTQIAVDFWTPLKGQIEPTAKVLFPLLKEGLGGVNEELGQTAAQTAKWMQSPLFKSRVGDIFQAIRVQASGLGDAVLGSLKGFVNLTDAAGPMLLKFSGVLTDFGKWAAGIGDTSAKQRELGKAFEYGWQKAAQLWDMLKNLGGALKSTFGAGRESGDRLLASLQSVIREWRTWADSAKGQNRMKEWFEAVEPIARNVGKLIVDIGKALGRLSEDSTTAGLIEKIRTELLPSLETFLKNLGTTLGPAVITFVTNVLEVLTQMSAAGSPLGQGLSVISQLIGGLADVFQAHPDLAKNVGILLGALLGFRALSFFGGLIPGIAQLFKFVQGGGKAAWLGAAGGIALFSGALSGLPGPVQGAVAALSTLLTLVPSFKNFSSSGRGFGDFGAHVQLMGTAFTEAKDKSKGFSGAMKGVVGSLGYGAGAIGGGLKGALSGAMGLLGGPWGIALVGASAAIGGYMQAQENARVAAEGFSDTLDKQTGKLTKASGDFAIKSIQDNISGEDIDRLDRLGISIGEAANAVTQGGPQLDAFRKKVTDLSTAQGPNLSQWGGEANDNRDALDGLNSQLGHLNDDIVRGKKINADFAQGQRDAANASTTLGDKMRALIPTATEVADALDRIAGITLSAREANRRAAESTDALNAALKANGKTHDDNTEKGRANNAALDAYAQAQVGAAKASAEAGASASTLRDKLETARAKFIASAKAAGYSETEAAKLATQMGLTGEAAKGMAAKVAAIKGKTVIVKVTDQASAIAAAAQRAIDSVTGKTVTIQSVFKTSGFQASLRAAQAVKNASVYFGEADGGIIKAFRDGGIERAIGRKIKSFANGAERHIAQIARGGEYRVWAEDETGGEAYIPLAQSKRGRSMEILSQVADQFGMALTPALSGAASAAGAAYASASTRGGLSDRPAPAGGPRVVIEPGGVIVNNPAPEPASQSVVGAIRDVGAFGLFGGEGEF